MLALDSYLASSINNLSCKVFTIMLYDSAKCVLNCWVIAFDKMALNETNSK